MSPDASTGTGSERLDQDLQTLFELDKAGRLAAVVKDAADPNLSPEDFAQLVPDSLLRIAFGLSDPEEYASLQSRVPDVARPDLERAKKLAETELKPLLSHQHAPERIRNLLRKSAESLTGLAKELRTITAIQSLKVWCGSPPELAPGVRLSFCDRTSRLLLDTTLGWDDLFFLISGLLEVAVDVLNSGRGLFEGGQLDFDATNQRRVAERLESIEASLNKIREMAPTYHITAPTRKPSEQGPKSDEGAE
jgi:hypothetical protein